MNRTYIGLCHYHLYWRVLQQFAKDLLGVLLALKMTNIEQHEPTLGLQHLVMLELSAHKSIGALTSCLFPIFSAGPSAQCYTLDHVGFAAGIADGRHTERSLHQMEKIFDGNGRIEFADHTQSDAVTSG